jgi:DNA-binding transcriptional ArsR family regulator
MLSHMMNVKILDLGKQQAAMCSVFGNFRRVLILWLLAEREMSVGEIAQEIGTSLQNTSQHLRLMKDKGFVSSRRDGQTIYYHIAENEMMAHCYILLNSPLRVVVPE